MTAVTRGPGENGGLDDFAYGRAARDLWRRISPGLSPRQIERFTASLAAFLDGCAVEIRAELTGDIPGYERRMAVREDGFGDDRPRAVRPAGRRGPAVRPGRGATVPKASLGHGPLPMTPGTRRPVTAGAAR